MSKKSKYVKSDLTARERKEMRQKEEAALRGEKPALTEEEYAVKKRRTRVFATAAIVVAVLLISAGIIIPSVMAANYMFERDPVAVFTFETGGKTYEVEYAIYAADYPNMANNFMYLASIGFFDGTVVFDTQNSQVRFGGYIMSDDGDYDHRSDDLWFANKLKDDFSPKRYENNSDPSIFKYQIKKDSPALGFGDLSFALCGNTSGSSLSATEFQFCCDRTAKAENLSPEPGSSAITRNLKLEAFGAPLDEDAAREVFDEILALPLSTAEDGTAKYVRKYFRAPAQTVTLESVKIYNYDAYWLDSKYEYGFESYMEELGAFFSKDRWNKNYL